MINQCGFAGRLGKDPEIKYFEGGKCKTTFSLAVDRPKFGGEAKTDWFRVELWGKNAENAAEWLKKGNTVWASGRLEMEEWKGQDGTKQVTPTLKANEFKNLTPKNEGAAVSGRRPLRGRPGR